jgi:hypothetical protein
MASVNPLYQILVPVGMLSIGQYLQGRDTNRTGADDAVGQILVAAAPAVTAALDGTQGGPAVKRAITSIRDAAQSYLDSNP